MNRQAFYGALRQRASGVFGTSLSQGQVDGMEAILDEASRRNTPLPHLAYMLSTAYHETGHKMVPNVENLNYTSAARIRAVWPSRFPTAASAQPFVRNPKGLANKVYNGRMGNRLGSDDGWNFRGRGLPHLTGRDNYAKGSQVAGVDLVANPERALDLPIAVKVFFDGMARGWYTGRKMSDYLDKSPPDYREARRIVNGLDKAAELAAHARAFEAALKAAGYSAASTAPAAPPRPDPRPQATKPMPASDARPEPTQGGKGSIIGFILFALAVGGLVAANFFGII